jgi:PPOX class probable F420-dependent enzyme
VSRRERIRMSAQERDAFLAEQRTLILTSLGRDGRPHTVPMWFVVRDGEVHTWTYASSQKARNLGRDPRATLLVEDGETYDQLRGVMLHADASVLDDPEEVFAVGYAIARRYAGAPTDPDALAGLEAFARAQATKRVAHRFAAVDITSWDHRKLEGGY